jgi:GAF domain-containing protein/two-component sensor histidine kinase
MESLKISPKKLTLKQAILLVAFLCSAAMFVLYKFLSHLFASEHVSKLELFLGGIFLVLTIIFVFFLTKKILYPIHGIVKMAETICSQKDEIETKTIHGKNDIGRLEQSLKLLSQDLKEKERKMKSLNRRLLALNVIATAVNQPRDTDQMFGDVLETTLEVTDFDWGIMYLLDEDKKNLRVKTWRGIDVDEIAEFDQIRLGEGIFGEAAEQEQIVFVPDVEKDDRPHNDKLKNKKVKSILAVPFLTKGEIFGVAALGSFSLIDLSVEENEFLAAIIGQVGMAIDNMNLLTSWAKKAKDLFSLLDISYAVSSSLNLDQVLKILSQRMVEIAEAELCYITLLDENRKNLRVEVVHSAQKPDFGSMRKVDFTEDEKEFSLDLVPHHKKVIETGKMVKITKVDKISSFEKKLSFAHTLEEVLLMPLCVGQRVLGIVGLGIPAQHKLNLEKLNLYKSVTSQTAIAIENAQLYEYLKQRMNEIYTIYNVAKSLSSILDLDRLLDEILRVIVGSFGYLNCAILLIDEKTNELYFKADVGFPENLVKNLRIKVGEKGIAGWVAHTGQPLVVGDVSKDPRYISGIEECKSEVAVPLKLKDRVIGVLDAESDQLFAFTQRDVRILSQLASQIAIAIENSRLFQEEKKRSLQLALINDVGRRVVSTLDLDKLLKRVIESIQINFKYNHISLFLVDEPTGDLVLKTRFGEDGEAIPQGFRLKMGVGMVGWAAKSRKTFLSNNVLEEPRYIPAIQRTKSALCVPLKGGQKVLGVLDVESFNEEAFDDRDVAVLETLADFLATAMNNVNLYEETKKKAHRLALTDQINRAISSTLDLESIFKIVSGELKKVMDFDRLSLAFWHPQQYRFELEFVYSEKRTITGGGKPLCADDTSMYEVVKTKKSRHIPKLSLETCKKSMDRLVFSEGTRSYLSIPILNEGEVIAVLNLESKKPFGFAEEQIELVNSIGGHLSVAIKNARLFSDLEGAYKSLKKAQDRLVQTEKLRAWGEMAGGVVHDFNNILTSVLGRAQLLLKKLEREEFEKPGDLLGGLKSIEESANDGTEILSRIDKFSKAKKETLLSPVDLNQMVEDSLEITQARWQDSAILSGIRIDVKKNLKDIEKVLGNATELREVVTNIIINAVDAMPEGGILSFRTEEDQRFIYLKIGDTGIGMDEDTQKKIFEPFFTTKGDKGTGLGMSVVYNIILRHDGEIRIKSSPGQGSTFIIKLPKCKGARDKIESVDKENLEKIKVPLT